MTPREARAFPETSGRFAHASVVAESCIAEFGAGEFGPLVGKKGDDDEDRAPGCDRGQNDPEICGRAHHVRPLALVLPPVSPRGRARRRAGQTRYSFRVTVAGDVVDW